MFIFSKPQCRFLSKTENWFQNFYLRWGIETSFRELKYAIGLTSFHARKPDFIKQEIYARLLLYNYCELITTHVIKQMKNNDKTKQVNFTIAIYICREGRMKKLSFFHTPFIHFIYIIQILLFQLIHCPCFTSPHIIRTNTTNKDNHQ